MSKAELLTNGSLIKKCYYGRMSFFRRKRIFLDYASATPVLPEVKRAMEKYWSEKFYNPSAIYEEGVKAKLNLEKNRAEIARILGVKKSGIIFTSGGTEANNLAILGAFESARDPLDQNRPILHPHLIISSIEHSSVRETAREVVRRGGEVSVVEADERGYVYPEAIKKFVKPNTYLVSVMLASNESGAIEPIAGIGRIIHATRKRNGTKFPYLHTDASQAANYLDVNLEKLNADFLTLDSSKLYGPKGIGALAIHSASSLRPIIFGGGQEGSLRAGTESLALVAGFVTALQIAKRDREKEAKKLFKLKQIFISELEKFVKSSAFDTRVGILSPMLEALPNIVAVQLPAGILSELIVLDMDRREIAVSSGSACLNLEGKPNESFIRFSFGRGTTEQEIRKSAKLFSEILSRARINS